ncbi:Protein Star, partial [Orchesella cincta]
ETSCQDDLKIFKYKLNTHQSSYHTKTPRANSPFAMIKTHQISSIRIVQNGAQKHITSSMLLITPRTMKREMKTRKCLLLSIVALSVTLYTILNYFQNDVEEAPSRRALISSLQKDSFKDTMPELDLIRKQFLVPPSPPNQRNLTHGEVWKGPVTALVHRLLKNKKNGFYIEAGAFDGEFISNTLALELMSGWTGLLVEADPVPYKELIGKRRNAWVASCCLSPVTKPMKLCNDMTFIYRLGFINCIDNIDSGENEFFTGIGTRKDYGTPFEVQCYPLYSVLSAIDKLTVDYFSLDIEGAELAVLKTIPFDKVSIKTISVEINNNQEAEVTQLLQAHGYKKMKYVQDNGYTHDAVYMKLDDELSSDIDKAELELDMIRDKYLTSPQPIPMFHHKRTRQLTKEVWKNPVTAFVLDLLKNKTYGFFVEAGANDGEFQSNTLQLEVFHGWTGLLVEADPAQLVQLRKKQRNAWIASCCLSSEPEATNYVKLNQVEVQCPPLHSLLFAIGQAEVDYLSLNLEQGSELAVLKTIPFDTISIKVHNETFCINIKVMSLEIRDVSTEIHDFLSSHNYIKMGLIEESSISAAVFMKVE